MPAHIAMLRAVNVSGKNSIRMERLSEVLTKLGFENVQTYVQSGNIVFLASKDDPNALAQRINKSILKAFGFDVSVIIRTAKEMERVITINPFLKEKGIDMSKLHVTFLSRPTERPSLRNLETVSTARDRFYSGKCEIYLHCPNGYGRTMLSNSAIEKALSVSATTRNWRTTNTLFEMASKL